MSDYLRSGAYGRWMRGDEGNARGEMARHTIHRTGARPLVGVCSLLGTGSVAGTGTTLYVLVIRRQASGYIVAREHMTIWEGSADSYEAELCPTPESVLAALGGDEMRSAEAEAWTEAVGRDEALRGISTVEI